MVAPITLQSSSSTSQVVQISAAAQHVVITAAPVSKEAVGTADVVMADETTK